MLNYIVVFDSKGLEKYGVLKDALEKGLGAELIKAHNEMARLTDEDNFYEKVNKEYHDLYENEDYIEFVNKKGQWVIDRLNSDDNFSKYLSYEFDDEHQLLGTWKQDKEVTISFYLKEQESI